MKTTFQRIIELQSAVHKPFGQRIISAKNTPIAEIICWRVDTCRFILAPKGLEEGPSAVGAKLTPPAPELISK